MSSYEELLSKLMEQKPELSKEDVAKLVEEKKNKIGAGYLTDQGAIFLIAGDMGITSLELPKTEIGLKDLHVGAKEVSLETRVLNMSPAKQFSRKDGSSFFLRTMTVYDADSTASVKLWDEKAKMPELEGLKPGDLVKIIKAYVKSDLTGAPVINIGSGSSVEPAENDSSIPLIGSITKDIGQIKENDNNIVVSGTLDGIISTIRFTNSKGQPNTALKMSLKGEDQRSIRIVLWGKDESMVPKIISSQARIKLYGIRAKQATQGLEAHGNDSTIISIEDAGEAKPIVTRIISLTKNDSGDHLMIGIDKDKNLINITDSSENLAGFSEGDMVECMPSKAHGNSVWLDGESFVRKIDDDSGVPTADMVRTKIANVTIGKNVCIESIVLKQKDRREIQTKNGETVSLSEMLVEDDSGQIWVKGWRDQARLVDKCNTGEIISITGLNAQAGFESKIELTMSMFSKIAPKNTSPKSL